MHATARKRVSQLASGVVVDTGGDCGVPPARLLSPPPPLAKRVTLLLHCGREWRRRETRALRCSAIARRGCTRKPRLPAAMERSAVVPTLSAIFRGVQSGSTIAEGVVEIAESA